MLLANAATQRSPRWRLFCAIELPAAVSERAAAHIENLRAHAPNVSASWDRPEKFHLTLKFIGEVELPRVGALEQAMQEAADDATAFRISIEGTGSFPPKGVPRVLWLGVMDNEGGLARLLKRLEDACAERAFPREGRAFRPHLTIARLRAPAGARSLAARHHETTFVTEAFRVSEIVLMRSELAAGGSRYTALSRHRFRAD